MDENPYPGINAHFNSFLQTPGTRQEESFWPAFHVTHISNISGALNAQLPRHYIAMAERSLQIRSLEDYFGKVAIQNPKSGVMVFQRSVRDPSASVAVLTVTPTWEATLAEVLEPIRPPMAVAIRELVAPRQLGRIVAWIELLSPSNKPGGGNFPAYDFKRTEALEADAPLIEIDYLHESPPLVKQLPRYPADAGSKPYSIIVSDPRPNWAKGKVRVYSFEVGQAIPAFPLPLAGEEMLLFDLNAVYQRTFKEGRWNDLLDYSQLPARFETYHADDQARIREVMKSVQKSE